MRKNLRVYGLLCMLLICAAATASAAPTDYSGTWVLDKAKSGELPRMWQNADSIELVVKQDKDQISVETKGVPSSGALTYKLDGSKTTAEMGGPMPGKATLSAKAQSDGKLELNTVREANFQGSAVTFTIKEVWELADNGKTLKVKRTAETPRGTQEYNLIFTRK
jgi:hypothetical protein